MTSFATQLGTGGMPAAFQTTFQTDADAFLILYHALTDAEQDEVEGTDATITASTDNILPQTLVMVYTAGSATELNFSLEKEIPPPPPAP